MLVRGSSVGARLSDEARGTGDPRLRREPSNALGATYLKDLRGLLTHILLTPRGRVTVDNAESFIKAGAWGLGLGSARAEPRLIAERRFDELPERVIAFLRIAAQAQRTT